MKINKNLNEIGLRWALLTVGAIGLLVIVLCLVFFNIGRKSEPFKTIREIYKIEDHELIATQEIENRIMVYSAGRVNNGVDNMYFVDAVKKSIRGYKWIDGAGHINRNLRYNKDFIFSTQLLNSNQDVNPTIFGIFSDENINLITVRIMGESYAATIYDGKDRDEKLYVISLEQGPIDVEYFMFTVTYTNGERLEFFIRGKEANEFQKGTWFYFYEEHIEN